MTVRTKIRLLPLGDATAFRDQIALCDTMTLREFLRSNPALSDRPIAPQNLELSLKHLLIEPISYNLVLPPGFSVSLSDGLPNIQRDANSGEPIVSSDQLMTGADASSSKKTTGLEGELPSVPVVGKHPVAISPRDAVQMSYGKEIDAVASFLRARLSVLVYCDKLVVEHLWPPMVRRSGQEAIELKVQADDAGSLMPRGMRQIQLAELKKLIADLKEGHVLVIPHLDLLAGGNDGLTAESRELTELVYQQTSRTLLAFADRTLDVPEVLAARFAARIEIAGVQRNVQYPDGRTELVGRALVTESEANLFTDFDPEGLYKNVAGLNPLRLRDAMRFAASENANAAPVHVTKLYHAIRAFKAKASAKFEVPDVRFDQIGGYGSVKNELKRALQLLEGAYEIPDERLRSELVPRGFIFYGPPGTGKTLFAKAIANSMNATIQVVSGPEVTDMYVGESERKVRELFSEARRNAPAVLVFDEIDSIASKRSGRDDGGSRAGNALVAQILTEMDGFRPDVQLLVIGTTNRLELIDDALLRPSRFKPINIGLPDVIARRAIAAVHAKHFGISVSEELLDLLAGATKDMNGDEIRSIFRDALVEQVCHKIEPSSRSLGKIVGRLRKAAQDRQASASGQTRSAPASIRPNDRIRPSWEPEFSKPINPPDQPISLSDPSPTGDKL